METQAPCLQKLADKDKWAYACDWVCAIVLKDEGVLHFSVKRGYWTDLASVPQALRGAFDNGSGDYGVLISSQVHDANYSTHYFSKDFADELFYAMLRFYGMGYIKAKLYYAAVHLFGDRAWDYLSESEASRDRDLIKVKWLSKLNL